MTHPISVALITYNRALFLRQNVPRLMALLSSEDECLIINNNSTDDTAEYLSSLCYSNIRVIWVERQGLNVCRNVALKEARFDHIAFIDDDAYPHPSWLDCLRRALAHHVSNVAIYAGKTLIEYQGERPTFLAGKFDYLLGGKDYGQSSRVLKRIESPGGGNMMVNRSIITELGNFDEQFDRKGTNLLSNGETELVEKIRSNGFTILYVPDVMIFHWAGKDRLNKQWLLKRMYWQGLSDGFLALKRNKYAELLLKRLLSHLVRVPIETVKGLRAPATALFTIKLEVAKTIGIVKSCALRIENV